jgi:lysophospholipase L1-like esterase
VPAEAHGERLHAADGKRVVLVPFRYADEYSQPPVELSQAFGTLACIDDSLAVSGTYGDFYETTYYRRLGKLINGPDRPIVNHQPLRGWSEESEVYGPLTRLLDAPAASDGADVIVLSVGLPDIAWDCPPDEFERHVAALVDLLSATKGCPVVLATPPPFRDTGSDVRLYAAAVQRVAQARDIPVADLYSAFMSAGEERDDLFVDKSDFVLSSRGHHLVARVMARAILMQAGEDR